MTNNKRRLLSIPEFAEALGVTTACGRRWALERKIVTVKLGRLIRVPVEEIDRLVAEGLKPRRAQ